MTTTQITVKPNSAAASALRPLVFDLGVPLGSYYLLRKLGVDLVPSLALSSVVPAVRAIVGLVRDRTINALATLIVVVNVVSIAVSFWTGDPRIMLAKDGAVSSTIGIAILLSVVVGRPLMTAGLKPMIVKGQAAKVAAFDRLSATSARFRRLERMFSLVWGVVLVSECSAKVFCAFTLPVGTMVWLSSVMVLGAIAVGIVVGSVFSVPMDMMVRREAAR
ncbi:MAG: VC0807 family protein [Streptosporangiaceae bacterium]